MTCLLGSQEVSLSFSSCVLDGATIGGWRRSVPRHISVSALWKLPRVSHKRLMLHQWPIMITINSIDLWLADQSQNQIQNSVFWLISQPQIGGGKGYLSNLLVITLLPRVFVYWARYFKSWLLAYFFILLNCAKFEEDWTTSMLDILQGSPLWIFGKLQKQKTSKGGTLVKCLI